MEPCLDPLDVPNLTVGWPEEALPRDPLGGPGTALGRLDGIGLTRIFRTLRSMKLTSITLSSGDKSLHFWSLSESAVLVFSKASAFSVSQTLM